ncbi:phosphocholine-specific phospholipase C [Olivibacter sitiensis]|uniref:phosphocholine-specific phospholipase C n=1 Tax=Olivibacter sitiensis TaxID=376470 RepID=UPI00042690AE|nr:phospholipase C, phosphocholine-specific [Olivibacter sitiensis]
MDSRRDFIKKAAMLAGGAGLWESLPKSIQKALQIKPVEGSTFYDAEHIVLLMQENRSFDHCFGTLQGVRGFNDPRAITLPNKNLVWLQSYNNGHTYAPFRMDIKNTKITWMESLPHSWGNQVDARNGGKYDAWLPAKRSGIKAYRDMPLTMGYYNREDIPFYYALADAFTVCDQHFCSSLTGTTTNRLFFWSGALKGKSGDIANVRNSDVYFNREVSWKTFPERLEENGISWRVYQNEISLQNELSGEDESWLGNFTDNNLEWFSQYHVRFSEGHYRFLKKRVEELPTEIQSLKDEISKLKASQTQKLRNKLEQKTEQLTKFKEELEQFSPENFAKLSLVEQNLHRKAYTTNVNDPHYHETEELNYDDEGTERRMKVPKGDVLYQFRDDVNSGKLPTVSWLVAPQNFSDHPSAPWYGAWYISEVLDILTKNPEVWKKTIFILNYDENDGCFDHIPPFVAPRPNDSHDGAVSEGLDTSDEYVTMAEEQSRESQPGDMRESPVGLGYRVPLIIASPWTAGGWVNSEVCDITSTIRFMEKFLSKKTGKEIRETNISSWRRAVTGDLTSNFRPFDSNSPVFDQFVDYKPFVKSIFNAQFKQIPDNYKRLDETEIKEANSNPLGSPSLPHQEMGIRKSSALPYQLHVDGGLLTDRKSIALNFKVEDNAYGMDYNGCPFTVYAPDNYLQEGKDGTSTFQPVKGWSYAVKKGDMLKAIYPLEHFENANYHLRVYGPNGFYRMFKGNGTDPELDIFCRYEQSNGLPTGKIILQLSKKGMAAEYSITLADEVYGKSAQEIVWNGQPLTLQVDTAKSYGWYDFHIHVKGFPSFERRFAGRVETGKHSMTDPYMGGLL